MNIKFYLRMPKSIMSRRNKKPKHMKKIITSILLIGILGTSCTNRLVDFTIISTKNIDMSKSANFQRGKTRAEGKDMIHIILFIPTGVPNIKTAIDRAIESVPGCVALLDGVLTSSFWWIPYIYGQSYYIVEGTPLIDPSMAINNTIGIPDYSVIKFDNNGNIIENKEVTQNEYITMKDKISKTLQKKEFSNTPEL
jgi:hypothetical protein